MSAAGGNTLLRNNDGRLNTQNPRQFGLPGSGLTSAWGDYDNDGDLDLAAVPGGMYRQREGFGFTRIGAFPRWSPTRVRPESPGPTSMPTGSATRDLRARETLGQAIQDLSPSRTRTRPATGSSSTSTGAPATARRSARGCASRTDGRLQTHWVGQNETSIYSQGHYRLYFGLGDATSGDGRGALARAAASRAYGPFAADQLRPRSTE